MTYIGVFGSSRSIRIHQEKFKYIFFGIRPPCRGNSACVHMSIQAGKASNHLNFMHVFLELEYQIGRV